MNVTPTPRLRGEPILGYLRAFRRDRVGLVLGLAGGPHAIVEVPMGIVRRVVVVSSPALVNEVLVAKQSAFVKAPGLAIFLRPVLGDGLLTSEKETHERQRRLLAPAFAPKRIAGYAATMAERTGRFVDALAERAASGETRIDVADAMMRLTFEIVGKTLFDAEVVGDATDVGEAITTAMRIAMDQLASVIPIPPAIPTADNRRYGRAVARLDDVVYRIIRERKAQGGDRGDVLSTLLEGGAMTDRQVRDEAMTLFSAGHETTANALAWTFDLLGRNPAVRARMEEELDALPGPPAYDDLKRLPYTLAVVKEAMRIYPPAYLLGRRAEKDVILGEHLVRRRSIVLLNVIGIHRRADLWPDPERFDPARFLGDGEKALPRCAYMPFGAGPRVCIGNHFALMEAHLLLATIARRLRFEPTSDAPPGMEPLVTLRPRAGVPARAVLREAAPAG
jgi:cytochrome P450